MSKSNLPSNDQIVQRSYGSVQYRVNEEKKTLEGHAAVYDQKISIGGYFYEVIERGAFDGCDLDDVLMSINHDLRKVPLARSRRNNGNSTMKLTVNQKGLLAEAHVDTENNADARAVYSSVERGDMDGMSFMFRIQDAKWTDLDTDMPTRHILKIRKVYELGPVNMPAYSGTDISARDEQALDNAKLALDNARSTLENEKNAVGAMKQRIKFLSKITEV